METRPVPQALIDAMAALGWREQGELTDDQIDAEMAALDHAAELGGQGRTISAEKILRYIEDHCRVEERTAGYVAFPELDMPSFRQAARKGNAGGDVDLPPEILERMQSDLEQAQAEKDAREA